MTLLFLSIAVSSPPPLTSPERHSEFHPSHIVSTVLISCPHSLSLSGITGAGGMPALKGMGQGVRRGDNSGPPNRILFVEEVTEIFGVTLPDLWKLGQAYLNGRLFQGVALLSENQRKLAKRCDSSKGKFEVRWEELKELKSCDLLGECLLWCHCCFACLSTDQDV